MTPRYKGFRGGYRFRRFRGAPAPERISFGIPDLLVMPLVDLKGKPIPALVKAGQQVRAGQILASDDASLSSPVCAPASGVVRAVAKDGRVLTIASDGSADWTLLEPRYPNWRSTAPEKLQEALYLSGITGFPEGGIPTIFHSSVIGPGDVEHIIVEAVYADVYSPRLGVLLAGAVEKFASGLALLGRMLPKSSSTVIIDRSERALGAELRAALAGGARLIEAASRYPLDHEAILLPAVLGGRFANGYRAIHHGVLVLDVQTVIQVHEAVVEGRPAIERTVALAGTGFARNIHLDARLGTPLEAIAKKYLAPGIESRIVINSPIRGEAVLDLGRPLDARIRLLAALPEGHRGQFMSFARPGFRADSYTPTFAASFLPLSKNLGTNLQGEERACISCGFCGDVCPARIMPQLLHRFVKRDVIDELILRYRIVDCIDCNLCTYVCPSKIPVAALIREGKTRLAAEGLEDSTPPVPRGVLKGV